MGTPGAFPFIDKNLGSIPSKGILFGVFLGELGIISLFFLLGNTDLLTQQEVPIADRRIKQHPYRIDNYDFRII
jgi:hypothetical protein